MTSLNNNARMSLELDTGNVGRIYDEQADKYISDFYRADSRILDIGCGTGRVIGHMIDQGCSPSNVVGVDPSRKLLEVAKEQFPDMSFVQTIGAELPFAEQSFDLITSNMVLHHMDGQTAADLFECCYEVLKPQGVLFFVDTDPDHCLESKSNISKWISQPTPWGTEVPAYNHNLWQLLLDDAYFAGFDVRAGWPLYLSEDGKVNPGLYQHYLGKSCRLAVRMQKISPQEKAFRQEHGNETIPSFMETQAY